MTFERTQKQAGVEIERGPAIGERFPVVELPDQFGRLTELHAVSSAGPGWRPIAGFAEAGHVFVSLVRLSSSDESWS
jgi:hypothetical protein